MNQSQRPNSRKSLFYVLVFVFAPPGFGLASALGAVPAVAKAFFLSALGFLGSRLLLFLPFAMAGLPSRSIAQPQTVS